jgi:hypothetical protein
VLLAVKSITIALLFRVGHATVDDGFGHDFVHNALAHATKNILDQLLFFAMAGATLGCSPAAGRIEAVLDKFIHDQP